MHLKTLISDPRPPKSGLDAPFHVLAIFYHFTLYIIFLSELSQCVLSPQGCSVPNILHRTQHEVSAQ